MIYFRCIVLVDGKQQMNLRLFMLAQGCNEEQIMNLQRFIIDYGLTIDKVLDSREFPLI